VFSSLCSDGLSDYDRVAAGNRNFTHPDGIDVAAAESAKSRLPTPKMGTIMSQLGLLPGQLLEPKSTISASPAALAKIHRP